MHIVLVSVHVRPECVDDFRQATLENARHSLEEPGIARFDVLQREDDASRFLLIEAYRSKGDPPRHRETSHYAAWKEAVEPMMEEPRSKIECLNVFPADEGWGRA